MLSASPYTLIIMKRRQFIKQTLLASAAVSMVGVDRLSAKSTVSYDEVPQEFSSQSFRKSMMWGTVGVKGSILEKCRAIKAAGFDGAEFNSHENREEVLAAMKATGLVASSVCNSVHWKKPLSSPDPQIRKEGFEGMIVAMEDAKAYGTDAVLLVPGTVSEEVGYDECWNRSTEEIKRLLPIAEKLRVKICIENVWNNFLLSPMEAVRYIDQFESPWVKSYFDIGNIANYGWPDQWIRILGNRIGRVHVKEFSKEKAEKEGRWKGFDPELLEGDIAWQKVIASIRKAGYGPWLTIEHKGGDTPEGLKTLSTKLDRIIAM